MLKIEDKYRDCFGLSFSNLIKENYKETFSQQRNKLFDSLKSYQGDDDRNDDVTVIGFKI